jgi:iron(III) transport system substrate-binding protein
VNLKGRFKMAGALFRRLVTTVMLSGATIAAAVGCRGDPRTPVYVYSPHGRDQLVALERAFESKQPGIDVRWLDMGSQEILDRIRFEKVNPQADVWFGGPTTMFDRGVAEGLLDGFRPSWSGSVDPRGIGPSDLYWPVYRTPAVIAYNREAVSEADAPRDWDDALDRRWSGKVLIREPMASGTMRAIWGHLIERELRRTGTLEAGFDWLRRLDAQTATYVINPSLLVEKLCRREGLVTFWDLPDLLIAQNQGRPLAYCFPSSGTVVIDDAIAVVRGARHPEAARAYIEFVGSIEAQILTARESFRLPARLDLPPERVPEWVTRVDREMKVADVDWSLQARDGSAWMAEWDRHVRGAGKKSAEKGR